MYDSVFDLVTSSADTDEIQHFPAFQLGQVDISVAKTK